MVGPRTRGRRALRDSERTGRHATLNSFLQHYNEDSALGAFLKTAIENLQLELGVDDCPFLYNYGVWGCLATESWVKALWVKLDEFGIDLLLEYQKIPRPRERDQLIMQTFVDDGCRGKELGGQNRARKCQEALYLSDIAMPAGRKIDGAYLKDWKRSAEHHTGNSYRQRLKNLESRPIQIDHRRQCSRPTSGHVDEPNIKEIGVVL